MTICLFEKSGRPRGPRKPLQKVGCLTPRLVGWSPGPRGLPDPQNANPLNPVRQLPTSGPAASGNGRWAACTPSMAAAAAAMTRCPTWHRHRNDTVSQASSSQNGYGGLSALFFELDRSRGLRYMSDRRPRRHTCDCKPFTKLTIFSRADRSGTRAIVDRSQNYGYSAGQIFRYLAGRHSVENFRPSHVP
jgi:hypothetical protein